MTKDDAWKKYLDFYSRGAALRFWESAIAPLIVREWKDWNHCILSDGSEWKP